MKDDFDYDVFISFSHFDEKLAKTIWQKISLTGLRVFWSDINLKKKLGDSWFDVIQSSLENSRHLILLCSKESMGSKWVQREYKAFYNHCYEPQVRRLIPVITKSYDASSLPLFIKELQLIKYKSESDIFDIVEALKKDNTEALKEEIKRLSIENKQLKELQYERMNPKRASQLRLSLLTLLVLSINSAIDSGKYKNISIDQAYDAIERKEVINFLKENTEHDFSMFSTKRGDLYFKDIEIYQQHMQDIYYGYAGQHRRKWGVENNGLALILAWTNEVIQQGKHWIPAY